MDNKPRGLIDRLKLSFAGGNNHHLLRWQQWQKGLIRAPGVSPCLTVRHPGEEEEFTESQDKIGTKDNSRADEKFTVRLTPKLKTSFLEKSFRYDDPLQCCPLPRLGSDACVLAPGSSSNTASVCAVVGWLWW
jgi:hypothetical protein